MPTRPERPTILLLVELGTARTTARFVGSAVKGVDGARHRLVVGSISEEGLLQDIARASGHEGMGLDGSPDRWIWSVERLARALDERGVDLVHAHEERCGILAAAAVKRARRHVRMIYHRHHSRSSTPGWLLMDTLAGGVADRVLGVSVEHANNILREHPEWRAKLVPVLNGTSFEEDRATAEQGATRLRAKHGLAAGIPIFVHVARLNNAKGHPYLLEAVAVLEKEGRSFEVVLVGDGPERDGLERQRRALGLRSVRFVGTADSVYPWFLLADVALLPSVIEACPLVVLEAMAAARPMVASNIAGIPEMVVNGETGLLVPSRDVGALAGAMRRYLDDGPLRLAHGDAGRARYETQFTGQQMARRWQAQWDDVLGRVPAEPATSDVSPRT